MGFFSELKKILGARPDIPNFGERGRGTQPQPITPIAGAAGSPKGSPWNYISGALGGVTSKAFIDRAKNQLGSAPPAASTPIAAPEFSDPYEAAKQARIGQNVGAARRRFQLGRTMGGRGQ